MTQFAVRMIHEPEAEVAEVRLYSAIGQAVEGGMSASEFVSGLKQLPAHVHINMHYNSGGGNPFEAVAMATALKAHPGGYTAICDGVCASSATIPFSVATERKMRKGSMLMIHNPSLRMDGFVTEPELNKAANKLAAVTDSAVSFYVDSTGKSEDSIRRMMADETWLSPEEARNEGFATGTIGSGCCSGGAEF